MTTRTKPQNKLPQGKYSRLVADFCSREGIVIPPGFYVHPGGRYVIIRFLPEGPRLVARRWDYQADVVNYIRGHAEYAEDHGEPHYPYLLLDFKENKQLHISTGSRLSGGTPFDLNAPLSAFTPDDL